MRARAVVGSIFASVGVLIIGWQVGASASPGIPLGVGTSAGGAATGTSSGTGTAVGTGVAIPAPSASATPGTTPPAAKPSGGVYTGQSVDTPFGPVQVKVSISGGKIINVVPLQLTNYGGRSVQISNYAAPILRQEVLQAQSANVNMIGGATYTSEGYLSSLQSALDRAKF